MLGTVLYQSYFEDWVDPDSILGVIMVVHSDVGEATRNGRSYKELLDKTIFFSNLVYVLPIPGLCMDQSSHCCCHHLVIRMGHSQLCILVRHSKLNFIQTISL